MRIAISILLSLVVCVRLNAITISSNDAWDGDHDYLPEKLELELAKQFRPKTFMHQISVPSIFLSVSSVIPA